MPGRGDQPPLRLRTRLGHAAVAARALPGLILSGRQRRLLAEMRAFSRRLPAALQAPLPEAMARLTPATVATAGDDPAALRRLADTAALLDRRSSLGLCLRRSLLRYHFLRRAGTPLVILFGARLDAAGPARRLAGHAWVTLNGVPYHEADENWRTFAVIYRWPEEERMKDGDVAA